ncbi:unnamed protein product [Linum tenue]|uniref:Transmembrane protein n=1 Tax=Linum tenue TaxID=586396 RepID=A0AAV0NDX0_9ROSI|nr:unnamed protein product [Linum tenue]
MPFPFLPFSAMANYLDEFRKWQYENYFFWFWVGGVPSLLGMILLALKDRLLTWVAVVAFFYSVYCAVKICLNGRWWPLEGLTLRLMHWTGRAPLQVGGFIFAVVIGILVTRAELKPWVVLAYTVYAYSFSRFMMFRVTFDFTSAWICTTASTAWGVVVIWNDEGEFVGTNLVYAVPISCVLVLLICLGKYLDEYRPATDRIYDKGRAGTCGFQERPENADPPPGFIQPTDGDTEREQQEPRHASVSHGDEEAMLGRSSSEVRAVLETEAMLARESGGGAMVGSSSSTGLADGILARRSGGDDVRSRSIDFTIGLLEFVGLKDKEKSRSRSM